MMSELLSISTCGGVSNPSILFSVPPFKDILIISPEFINNNLKPAYYGDTINISFWKLLGLSIGTKSDTYDTLKQNYKYIYNAYTHTLYIYNDNSIEDIRYNIKSIGDMKVSFGIIKSHQFIILITNVDEMFPFYMPCNINKRLWHEEYQYISDVGINNTDDSYEDLPRTIHYIDNYTSSTYSYTNDVKKYSSEKLFLTDTFSYICNSNIDWSDITINNFFVNDEFHTNNGIRTIRRDPNSPNDPNNPGDMGIVFGGSLLEFTYLLPIYAMSLYPELMPILLSGETLNNRPVYEPWMIYGLYKFIVNRKYDDGSDTLDLFTFDLSPTF